MKREFKHNILTIILTSVCIFVGAGAMCGFVMIYDPTGRLMMMDGLLPYFQKLPLAQIFFKNFTVPGIALICINGVPNIVAAAAIVGAKRWGVILGGLLGITLMMWIVIQFVIFPFNYLSTTFFVVGIIQAAVGYRAFKSIKKSSKC